MPLINLTTDLKSLKYGNDRPGGASSGQPFLFTGFDIPNVDIPPSTAFADAYNESAAAGVGQNFFDIPTVTFNLNPTGIGNNPQVSIFKGNGVDIASPIIKTLDGATNIIGNAIEGASNAVINTINNSFDTTRNPAEPDFLWRKNRYNIAHSFADVVRITKFLSTPSGIFFVLKQELLERQNPKTNGSTRLYNPASTIVQVGVNSIGYHLNKSGLDPFEQSYFKGGRQGYFFSTQAGANVDGGENGGGNRLTLLYRSKITGQGLGTYILNPWGVTGPNNENDLLKYNGGPGAPLGIGFTHIRLPQDLRDRTFKVELRKDKTIFVFENKNDKTKLNYLKPSGVPTINWYYKPYIFSDENTFKSTNGVSKQAYLKISGSGVQSIKSATSELSDTSENNLLNRSNQPNPTSLSSTTPYSSIISRPKITSNKNTSLSNIPDFRTFTEDGENGKIPTSSYSQFNRENQINVGGNGAQGYGTSTTNYRGNYKNGIRIINPNIYISHDQTEAGVNGEDIIDFNFNIINNDDSSNNRLIDFRAYLESWNDGVKADWNSVKYMGRAEEFYKYGGFSRDVSISFLVPALSRGDMIANYRKVNALMWSVAPSYSPKTGTVSGLMRGSITKVTMGNYFVLMPSIIRSVEVAEIEGMGWDINRKPDGTIIKVNNSTIENPYVGQLPKGLKVTVSFTPLHNFVPQYGEAFIGQSSVYVPPKHNGLSKSVWGEGEREKYLGGDLSGLDIIDTYSERIEIDPIGETQDSPVITTPESLSDAPQVNIT